MVLNGHTIHAMTDAIEISAWHGLFVAIEPGPALITFTVKNVNVIKLLKRQYLNQ